MDRLNFLTLKFNQNLKEFVCILANECVIGEDRVYSFTSKLTSLEKNFLDFYIVVSLKTLLNNLQKLLFYALQYAKICCNLAHCWICIKLDIQQ